MATERIPEIDWLKGAAILCTILIHAGPMDGHPFFEAVLNRAVPVFAVVFGMNAETWWRARAGAPRAVSWWTTRVRRILVPAWLCLVLWWVMVVTMAPAVPHGWGYALAAVAGYAPWVGTSWFLTMVVELALVFPALRLFVDRAGVWTASIAAAICTASCWVWLDEVTHLVQGLLGGMVPTESLYFWVFGPRFFWHVVAGVAITRLLGARPGRDVVRGAALVFAGGTAVRLWGMDEPFHASALQALLDVPLTLALLGLFRLLRYVPPLARALAWLGVASWGVYLGQLLGHNTVILSGNLLRIDTHGERWAYAAALTAVSVVLAATGRGLAARFRRAIRARV